MYTVNRVVPGGVSGTEFQLEIAAQSS
eukprot:COSAG02_NODE_64283_length_261_cov_0.574074_1_plen_26_part_01